VVTISATNACGVQGTVTIPIEVVNVVENRKSSRSTIKSLMK
jgi:hypothetical protein